MDGRNVHTSRRKKIKLTREEQRSRRSEGKCNKWESEQVRALG